MMKPSLIRMVTLSALVCGALGAAVAGALAADNNPAGFIVEFPAHQLNTAQLGNKRVRFFAEVLTDSVNVDVVSITRNTQFNIQALVACTGGVSGFLDQDGRSPLSPGDDARFICPPFTRGSAMMGGLGIAN